MSAGDYQLEDTVYLPFTTRAFSSGVPTALVSGEVQIYEDANVTQITTAETLTVSIDSITGFNMCSVAATAANGFGTGQSYTAILSAGTVDSVSVVGEVVGHFTVEMSAAALDLANGTDGLGAIKADTALVLLDTGTDGVRIDWSNIQNPTATVALTGTTVDLLANAVDATSIATGAITSAKFATDAINAASLAADAIAEIVAGVLDDTVETNGAITMQEAISIILAFAAGESSGQTGTSPVFSDPSGTSTRIAGTTDGSGNRTAITLTPSA